jgi:hypothetical protein
MTARFGQRNFVRESNEPPVSRYLRASGDLQMDMFETWPVFEGCVDADVVLVLPFVLAKLSDIEDTSKVILRKNMRIVRSRLLLNLAREIAYPAEDILSIRESVSPKDEKLIKTLAIRFGLSALLSDGNEGGVVSEGSEGQILYFSERMQAQ